MELFRVASCVPSGMCHAQYMYYKQHCVALFFFISQNYFLPHSFLFFSRIHTFWCYVSRGHVKTVETDCIQRESAKRDVDTQFSCINLVVHVWVVCSDIAKKSWAEPRSAAKRKIYSNWNACDWINQSISLSPQQTIYLRYTTVVMFQHVGCVWTTSTSTSTSTATETITIT